MDRGAWWAIVHGVAYGWTRLKRLSKNINFLGAGWDTFSQTLEFLKHLEF